MAKLHANCGDPNQTWHSAASDLGLHCLPSTLLRVSRLQWDDEPCYEEVLVKLLLFQRETILAENLEESVLKRGQYFHVYIALTPTPNPIPP